MQASATASFPPPKNQPPFPALIASHLLSNQVEVERSRLQELEAELHLAGGPPQLPPLQLPSGDGEIEACEPSPCEQYLDAQEDSVHGSEAGGSPFQTSAAAATAAVRGVRESPEAAGSEPAPMPSPSPSMMVAPAVARQLSLGASHFSCPVYRASCRFRCHFLPLVVLPVACTAFAADSSGSFPSLFASSIALRSKAFTRSSSTHRPARPHAHPGARTRVAEDNSPGPCSPSATP